MDTQSSGCRARARQAVQQQTLPGSGVLDGAVRHRRLTLAPHTDAPPPVVDTKDIQGCYVLRGTLAVTIGDRTVTLHPGEATAFAPGVRYTVWNPTAAPAEALLIVAAQDTGAAPMVTVEHRCSAPGPHRLANPSKETTA